VTAEAEAVARPFVRQLAWREFAYHVLDAFPALASEPWRPEFWAMPWRDDAQGLQAWIEGQTGFPLVDAGMRQLRASGWMHNRVRLVTASFLTKDLLLPWQVGEQVFAELLADYDAALNAFNWQWVAGSGADASPYFRVFNPTTQAKKFDPEEAYVRHWVPELGSSAYDEPLIDHAEARSARLSRFEQVRLARRKGGPRTA